MINLKRKERLKSGLLKIGEVAKEAGVLPSCIRYYTKLGLLDSCGRTQGDYRLYKKDETFKKLAEIKNLKNRGVILEKMRGKV